MDRRRGRAFLVLIGLLSVGFLWKSIPADASSKVDGLIFWGTSNVSRLYGDLCNEVYSDSRYGQEEADQHIWTSFHSAGGAGYDYLNAGKFANYTVSDAPDYAVLADWYSGWSTSNTDDLRISAGQRSLSGAVKPSYWSFTGDGTSAPSVVPAQVDLSGSVMSVADGIRSAQNDRGWDMDKTAVVLWAGEDWVVRNKESDDSGLQAGGSLTDSARKILQVDWMGLDVETNFSAEFPELAHSFDPAPWVSSMDPYGDVKHENTEGQLLSHYGKEMDDVKECPTDSRGWVDYAKRLSGLPSGGLYTDATSANGDFQHAYVYGNSYRIRDELLGDWVGTVSGDMVNGSGFSYNLSDDHIDVTLSHSLVSETDAFPSNVSLSQQAGQAYARVISGYDYQVEYLEHDFSKTPPPAQVQSGKYWFGTYSGEYYCEKPEYTERSWTSSSSSEAHDWEDDGAEGSVTYKPGEYPVADSDEYFVIVKRTDDSSSADTDAGGKASGNSDSKPKPVHANPETYTNPNGYPAIKQVKIVKTGSKQKPVYADDGVTVDHYDTEYSYTQYARYIVHYPARYDWSEEDLNPPGTPVEDRVYDRCDKDLNGDGIPDPAPGYADSWHTHLYGGADGFRNGTNDTVDSRPEVEHYADGSFGGLTGSEADHKEDYREIQTWYTNPDKPIMKVVVETRDVTGYADYWRKAAGDANLMIYVFGLGPYNKAVYDDQKDEDWLYSDGSVSERDTNGDGVFNEHDRVSTNNAGTALMTSSADPGPNHVKAEWLLGGTEENEWDLPARGGGGTSGSIDEIARTDRVDSARRTFNQTVKSNLRGVRFIDIWDETYYQTPYFRYQDNFLADGTLSLNAQHGKWYDQSTNNWIFHMIWSTILRDNPEPQGDDAIDLSLYGVSCALTAYANEALSPAGREDNGLVIHAISDILSAGPSGAGAALGYGDSDYGFQPYIMTGLSETSSTVDYQALLELDDPALYEYARYGHLLQDMGLDQTAAASVVSPRLVPGILMTSVYIANSALSVIWSCAVDLLKLFNPFQVFHDASAISTAAKSGMYGSQSILVQLAQSNEGVRIALQEIGAIYDTLTGVSGAPATGYDPFTGTASSGGTQSFSFTMLYLVVFLAGSLLFFSARRFTGHWPHVKKLLIRLVFFAVGVPILGVSYTAFLNGVSDVIPVTSAPSSQMIAATFVDFDGWVKDSRLNPPAGAVLESQGDFVSAAGKASDSSIRNLRNTAWQINQSAGSLSHVDMTAFVSSPAGNPLTDSSAWVDSAFQPFSQMNDSAQSILEVSRLLMDWTQGSLYYASDFESESMSDFSHYYPDRIGYRKAADSTGTMSNENTLYQMYQATGTKDQWLSRSVMENTEIFQGTGAYGASSTQTNWSSFNIYANGTLSVEPVPRVDSGTLLSYQGGTPVNAPHGTLQGLSLASRTGLSTLSMYNYLLTDFGDSLTVYSALNTPNAHVSVGHYSTNSIGSGVTGVVFWLSCFVFLFVTAILGFVYAFKMVISVLKNGIHFLLSIPGAMIGVMGSIARVVQTVILMILEILGSIFLYGLLSDLLLVLATAFERPLSDAAGGIEACVAGGILGWVRAAAPFYAGDSAEGYLLALCGVDLFFLVISILAIRKAPVCWRIMDKACELSFSALRSPCERQAFVPNGRLRVFSGMVLKKKGIVKWNDQWYDKGRKSSGI